MKATVTQPFVDKHTRQKYAVGAEYEGDSARIDELAKAGHVAKPEAQESKTESAPPTKQRRTRRNKE